MSGLLVLLCRVAGSLAIAALVLIVAAEVVARNLLGFSLLVADEYAGYLALAITFLGIPYALQEDALLRVDAVIANLRGRPRAGLEVLFNALMAVIAGTFAWQFGRMALRTWERGTFASTPAQTPLWIPQSVMWVGAGALTVVALSKLVANLRRLAAPGPAPEGNR